MNLPSLTKPVTSWYASNEKQNLVGAYLKRHQKVQHILVVFSGNYVFLVKYHEHVNILPFLTQCILYRVCQNWRDVQRCPESIVKICFKRVNLALCLISILRPRQNGRQFADDILKCIFLIENVWSSLKISLKFVPRGPINNIPALVQIMAWRRPGDKPLSESMVVSLLMHIHLYASLGLSELQRDLVNGVLF